MASVGVGELRQRASVLLRINDRVLEGAGVMQPPPLRSLDAIPGHSVASPR